MKKFCGHKDRFTLFVLTIDNLKGIAIITTSKNIIRRQKNVMQFKIVHVKLIILYKHYIKLN